MQKNMEKNKFYITTPIYYVNAKPHIGHAYTTIAADVLARFYRQQLGKENVFFLTGTDEHGAKIQKKAEEAEKNPQEFVDEISSEFKKLWAKDKLNIEYDNFIRTTDENHKKAVQKVLQTLLDRGAIYKGEYEGLYCVGCEQFKNEDDLVDGKCPDHGTAPELMKEESYMLKMTEIQKQLIGEIESDEFMVAPEKYKNEILSFLCNQELRDISISRKNVSWGIPLPFDESHTTYVWVDAFLNYLTGLGWDGDENNLPKFWPVDINLIGKDILRVHATIWPAILIHLGIKLPKILFTHGHILSVGKKMSKTLGNTISIDEMLEKFGTDGTRYLLLSAGPFGGDIDVTMERMVEKYNADLANGLGNLVSRVVKLISSEKINYELTSFRGSSDFVLNKFLEKAEFNRLVEFIWERDISEANEFIDKNKPWKLAKEDRKKFEEVMFNLVDKLIIISEKITPLMPEISEKIKKALETKKLDEVLFARIK
jgi:methionyl-tRNA synthetase